MPFVLENSPPILYPPDMGPLNPLYWIRLAGDNSAFRHGVLATAAVLTVGCGWFVRLAARPRTPQAALAAGAMVGLVTTLVVMSLLGPLAGAEAFKVRWLRLHPVSDWGEMRGHVGPLPPEEELYLARYLPVEERPFGTPGRLSQLVVLQGRAVDTNRLYAAIILGWMVLFAVSVFFLGLILESTWAADHLARSGRGPIALAICYLELYPAAAALLLSCLTVLVMAIVSMQASVRGGPPWGVWSILLGTGACLVALAHVGVVRRWHPAVRIAVYIVTSGLGFACTSWAS
jgi:hypothetical protein